MLVPSAIAVVVACWIYALRLPSAPGGNKLAVVALVLALVGVAAVAAVWVFAAPIPVAAFVLAVLAVQRVPAHGRKRTAIAALGVSGLAAALVVAQIVACVVTDACFH